MKKIVSLLVILSLLLSCKEETVNKPEHFIEKGVMMDIMYDLSLLEAIKSSDPNSLEVYKVNPKGYIYKKYKVDSAQFSQNNIYYATHYEEYKEMYDRVAKRIDDQKIIADSLVKTEKKRDSLNLIKKKTDSLKLVKRKLISKKDSLRIIKKKLSIKDSLHLIELRDLLKKDSMSRIKGKIISVKKTHVR